jgi:hypothetical protein
MPRPKEVYCGHGEWVELVADYRTCEHPRDSLYVHPFQGLPLEAYCLKCGARDLSPLHGLSDEELAESKRRAGKLWEALQPPLS